MKQEQFSVNQKNTISVDFVSVDLQFATIIYSDPLFDSQAVTLHVAQSQHHDIIVATKLGYKTFWIERRQGMKGFGGTPAVAEITKPTYHFSPLKALADAVEAE